MLSCKAYMNIERAMLLLKGVKSEGRKSGSDSENFASMNHPYP
jgi:hypothetical protein